MCPYIYGTFWWGRWPPPARRGVTSLRAPQRRSTTCPRAPSWSPCLWTASQLRGERMIVPRVLRPPWRGECYCGWHQTDSTPADCVRAECTGRQDCHRTERSSTSWREKSPVNSSTRRTTSQVRHNELIHLVSVRKSEKCWSWLTMWLKQPAESKDFTSSNFKSCNCLINDLKD